VSAAGAASAGAAAVVSAAGASVVALSLLQAAKKPVTAKAKNNFFIVGLFLIFNGANLG
jgi:hypothetical protein